MTAEKVINPEEKAEDEWQRAYDKRYKSLELDLKTAAGIPIKPVYSPKDAREVNYENIGMPGVYPFTRGSHPLMYQYTRWTTQQGFGFGLPEHTRERYDVLRREGLSGYAGMEAPFFLIGDEVTTAGYDPDNPIAKGRVGKCGVSWCTTRDLERLFHDLPLDKMFTVWNIFLPSPIALAMYIVTAEKMGFPTKSLRGVSCFYVFEQMFMDHPGYEPENALKLAAEHTKFCARNIPYWNSTSFDGYALQETGANAVQELAFMFAEAIATTEATMKAGLSPDDFVSRFGFHIAAGDDFFENVCKIRALRQIWARLTKERFGCQQAKSWRASTIQVETAGDSLTAQQPLNNIARAAIQTLAAVLGSANSIWTTHYDEALSIPTEESATICLRTQQIILHETNVPNVVDPLGGSYYVEWLTNKMVEDVMALIRKIDDMTFVEAIKNGWIRQEIEGSAWEYRKALETGDRVKVGVNKYATDDKLEMRLHKADPEVEKIAIQRVQEFRAQRDSQKTDKALQKMRQVAENFRDMWPDGPEIMPAIIEAVRADATLGEMMEVMRQTFGFRYSY